MLFLTSINHLVSFTKFFYQTQRYKGTEFTTLCILIKPKNASVSPCLYVQIQLFAGLLLDYLLKTAYILANFGIGECIILQVTADESVVRRHIDKSMT